MLKSRLSYLKLIKVTDYVLKPFLKIVCLKKVKNLIRITLLHFKFSKSLIWYIMHVFWAWKLYHFNCTLNAHLEKLETINRSSVLKNGLKIWFLAFLNYRCDHLFLSNRFLLSFYLAFTNGFDQKKTSSYVIFDIINLKNN